MRPPPMMMDGTSSIDGADERVASLMALQVGDAEHGSTAGRRNDAVEKSVARGALMASVGPFAPRGLGDRAVGGSSARPTVVRALSRAPPVRVVA